MSPVKELKKKKENEKEKVKEEIQDPLKKQRVPEVRQIHLFGSL